MRLRKGQSIVDAYQSLSEQERQSLSDASRANTYLAKAEQEHRSAQEELHYRIWQATDAGVPVALIAEDLGLTPARVYQMRDRGRAVGHRRSRNVPA